MNKNTHTSSDYIERGFLLTELNQRLAKNHEDILHLLDNNPNIIEENYEKLDISLQELEKTLMEKNIKEPLTNKYILRRLELVSVYVQNIQSILETLWEDTNQIVLPNNGKWDNRTKRVIRHYFEQEKKVEVDFTGTTIDTEDEYLYLTGGISLPVRESSNTIYPRTEVCKKIA